MSELSGFFFFFLFLSPMTIVYMNNTQPTLSMKKKLLLEDATHGVLSLTIWRKCIIDIMSTVIIKTISCWWACLLLFVENQGVELIEERTRCGVGGEYRGVTTGLSKSLLTAGLAHLCSQEKDFVISGIDRKQRSYYLSGKYISSCVCFSVQAFEPQRFTKIDMSPLWDPSCARTSFYSAN